MYEMYPVPLVPITMYLTFLSCRIKFPLIVTLDSNTRWLNVAVIMLEEVNGPITDLNGKAKGPTINLLDNYFSPRVVLAAGSSV